MCRDGKGCVWLLPDGAPPQLCEKEIDPKFKVHTAAEALALITSAEAWAFANAGPCTSSSNACLGTQKWLKKNGRMFALMYALEDAEAQAVMLEMLIRAAENLKLNMDYFYRLDYFDRLIHYMQLKALPDAERGALTHMPLNNQGDSPIGTLASLWLRVKGKVELKAKAYYFKAVNEMDVKLAARAIPGAVAARGCLPSKKKPWEEALGYDHYYTVLADVVAARAFTRPGVTPLRCLDDDGSGDEEEFEGAIAPHVSAAAGLGMAAMLRAAVNSSLASLSLANFFGSRLRCAGLLRLVVALLGAPRNARPGQGLESLTIGNVDLGFGAVQTWMPRNAVAEAVRAQPAAQVTQAVAPVPPVPQGPQGPLGVQGPQAQGANPANPAAPAAAAPVGPVLAELIRKAKAVEDSFVAAVAGFPPPPVGHLSVAMRDTFWPGVTLRSQTLTRVHLGPGKVPHDTGAHLSTSGRSVLFVLAELIHSSPSIKELTLSWCDVDAHAATVIASALGHAYVIGAGRLRKLIITDSIPWVGNRGARALAWALQQPKVLLEELTIDQSDGDDIMHDVGGIGREGAQDFLTAAQSNLTLTRVQLSPVSCIFDATDFCPCEGGHVCISVHLLERMQLELAQNRDPVARAAKRQRVEARKHTTTLITSAVACAAAAGLGRADLLARFVLALESNKSLARVAEGAEQDQLEVLATRLWAKEGQN